MYFSVENVLNFFPVKHRARYNLMVLRTPWLYMYLFKKLITFVPEALFIISANGYFEYLSTLVYEILFYTFFIKYWPTKVYLYFVGITDFKFIPISEQALHSLAFASISRWIYGHQLFCAS